MANGRPGDNEITDILVRDRQVFGGGVDQEVVALVRDFPRVRPELTAFVASEAFQATAGKARARRQAMREKIADIRARETGQTEKREAFKKLRRPFPIWLITVLLAYSIFGTVLSLTAPEKTYDPGVTFLGILASGVSAWLIVEMWRDGPRQVALGWALVGVTALIYANAVVLFEPVVGSEVTPRAQYVTVGVFGLFMVGLHMLIPWYLARRKNTQGTMS